MRILWTVLASLALSQAALAQDPSDREIIVRVNKGVIEVDPERAVVRKNQNRLVWKLRSKEYTFADPGIVVKAGEKDYGECNYREKNKDVWVCKKLRHLDKKEFKYDVKLLDSSGKPLDRDPYIVNE